MNEALYDNARHASRGEALGSVRVEPGHMEPLVVGTYPQNALLPKVELHFQPYELDGLVCTPTPIEEGGRIRLVYHCQNFGQVACVVSAYRSCKRV